MKTLLLIAALALTVLVPLKMYGDTIVDTRNRKGHYITKVDYDSAGNAVYVGFAPSGSQDTDTRWTILKSSYNASNNFIFQQTCPDQSKWSARATLTCN